MYNKLTYSNRGIVTVLLFVLLTTFVFSAITVTATIDSSITTSTQQSLHKTLLSSLSSVKTPKEIHYATVSLLKLPYKRDESKNAIDAAQTALCSLLKLNNHQNHLSQLSLNDLYNTVASISALKCTVDATAIAALESRLKSLIGSSVSNMDRVYDAVRSLFLFRKQFKTFSSDQTVCNR